MADEAPLPAPPPAEPEPTPAERRLARIRIFQILLALGVLSAIAGAVLSVSVAIAVRPAVLWLPPGAQKVAQILLMRLWVLAVAPLAAWGAGRVLNLRPWATAFAVAGWGEALFVVVDLAVSGFWAGVYRDGVWFTARVLTLGLGMVLGWRLARRGRAAAERVKARHQAEAEATRARYAKWLEEQRPGPGPGSGPGSPGG
ncbi:MAG TPA: hypothetical protein VND93_16990 [Myxococcales bacterium]|nr:hypothetical protein [Myxococcales bacterium]